MTEVTLAFPLLVGLIAVALLFDFLNGLHDAANSIATIVSTRVLRPQYAVLWAAFFNFIAFLFFGLHVAQTLGTGIIDAGIVTPQVIFSALVGAIVWNVVTWIFGIPSSSSHALVGGLLGAGLAKVGLSAVVWSGVLKTAAAIVLSPLVGFLLALLLVLIVSWICRRATPFGVDRTFRILQFASASLYSLGHGGNDAQKTMGIIALLLYSQGYLGGEFHVPLWVEEDHAADGRTDEGRTQSPEGENPGRETPTGEGAGIRGPSTQGAIPEAEAGQGALPQGACLPRRRQASARSLARLRGAHGLGSGGPGHRRGGERRGRHGRAGRAPLEEAGPTAQAADGRAAPDLRACLSAIA
jgi:hypothetical protein